MPTALGVALTLALTRSDVSPPHAIRRPPAWIPSPASRRESFLLCTLRWLLTAVAPGCLGCWAARQGGNHYHWGASSHSHCAFGISPPQLEGPHTYSCTTRFCDEVRNPREYYDVPLNRESDRAAAFAN